MGRQVNKHKKPKKKINYDSMDIELPGPVAEKFDNNNRWDNLKDQLFLEKMQNDRALDFAINFPQTIKSTLEERILANDYKSKLKMEAQEKIEIFRQESVK